MKQNTYIAVLIIAIMAVLSYCMTSCNPYGYDIWHEDDPYYHPPVPVVDTCAEYQVITTPPFSTWSANLDVAPTEYKFYYKWTGEYIQINLHDHLLPYGQSTEYLSGINVAGIVDGLNNPSYVLNHSLYIKDGAGVSTSLIFNPYLLVFNGALTFDQMFNVFITHLSFKRLGFWNTAYSCDQYNQFLDYLIDHCIDGHGKTLDLRHIQSQCPTDQDRLDRLATAHYTVII